MFGGHGIYHDDHMFGLVADDELYLKADAETVAIFTEHGSTPFEFNKDGKMMTMSYYHAPEEIYDDPDEAVRWASLGFAAALRAKAKKKPKANKKTKR